MDKFQMEIKSIIEYIHENNGFIVASHVNPDGDNIGSSLAMYRWLKKIGKDAEYIMDDEYPSNLKFLYDENARKKSEDVEKKAQTLIALDAGSYERICVSKEVLDNVKGIICVDHHVTNGKYGFLKYIDSQASSTCELVYNLIKAYEKEYTSTILDADIATPLYTGLLTDTGNFQYSNTNKSSFIMAADLIERGADKDTIVENLYQNNSFAYYKILGETLSKLEIYDSQIAIASVSRQMLNYYGIGYEDIDPITPYTRDIEGVELGIFLKEKELGEIKVSFRSKRYVDCTKIASVFGGGGHVRASGCTIKDVDMNTAKEMVIREAKKHLSR